MSSTDGNNCTCNCAVKCGRAVNSAGYEVQTHILPAGWHNASDVTYANRCIAKSQLPDLTIVDGREVRVDKNGHEVRAYEALKKAA